jgi:diguanylate cyclase (GGDEF)-like protein
MRWFRVADLWSSRDPDLTARAGVWFASAGGAVAGLLSLLTPRAGGNAAGRLATLVVAALLLLLAGCGRWRPHAVPAACWALLPLVAATAVVTLNLATSDASAGAQVFLVWPVLYASYLLRPFGAAVVAALVAAGEVLVVVAASATPVSDSVGLISTFSLMSWVVVRLRDRLDESQDALAQQALRDPLTGLLNRRAFDRQLPELLGDATAGPVTLLALDLDHLKEINDRAGHAGGDRALCRVAAALQTVGRSGDLVFRIGGDEFCVVLPGCGSRDALTHAEEIRVVLQADAARLLTVSIGIATAPDDGTTAVTLLDRADRALYAAKRQGRDRASCASAA